MAARSFLLSSLLVVALGSASAAAHTVLTEPEPRVTGMTGSSLKARPCGRGPGEVRSDTVTTFQAGETITVSWHETIPHPGYWRIAFDDDGQDFVDPPTPRATGYSDTVLADVIYPSTPAEASARWGQENLYSFQVTLPDTGCDHCTLQLIQFMEDKLADGNPDNDIYYSCADLVLVALPADDTTAPDDVAGPDAVEPETVAPETVAPETVAPEAVPDPELPEDVENGDDGAPDSSGGSAGACTVGGHPMPGAWLPLLLLASLATLGRRLRAREPVRVRDGSIPRHPV